MGCCNSFLVPEEPGARPNVPVQRDDAEPDFVNDDTDKDNSPLLNSPVGRNVNISASSSSSEVDRDMIQRLLEEVDEMSD